MVCCPHENEGTFNSQFVFADHCAVLVSLSEHESCAGDTQIDYLPFQQP